MAFQLKGVSGSVVVPNREMCQLGDAAVVSTEPLLGVDPLLVGAAWRTFLGVRALADPDAFAGKFEDAKGTKTSKALALRCGVLNLQVRSCPTAALATRCGVFSKCGGALWSEHESALDARLRDSLPSSLPPGRGPPGRRLPGGHEGARPARGGCVDGGVEGAPALGAERARELVHLGSRRHHAPPDSVLTLSLLLDGDQAQPAHRDGCAPSRWLGQRASRRVLTPFFFPSREQLQLRRARHVQRQR